MRRICVFCGSRLGGRPIYADEASRLGDLLADRGWALVYGGGHIGLMGILADSVLRRGGQVIGVIPQALVDKELAHAGLTELHVVATMHERKAVMADLSDAFVALPGAFGTADELFEILTWAQLGIHTKPIGLLNTGGFFSPLLHWLDHCVDDGFLKLKHRQLLLESADPRQVLDKLVNHRPAASVPNWVKKTER
jgi:uncharacterized protein (TIGR00730 family)